MKKFYIILLFIIINSCACPSIIKEYNTGCEKLSIIKNKLKLNKDEYKVIKKNDSIINDLYASIKDTVKVSLINRRLDSLLSYNYTKKEFFSILKMDRAFKKSKTTIEISRKKDTLKVPNFNSAENAAKYHKEVLGNIKEGISVKNDIIQDSNSIKKDSIN